jgi:hypothetical protein
MELTQAEIAKAAFWIEHIMGLMRPAGNTIDVDAHALASALIAIERAEREACAKIAEGEINGDFRSWPHQPGDYDNVCMQSKLADAIAASIRNR